MWQPHSPLAADSGPSGSTRLGSWGARAGEVELGLPLFSLPGSLAPSLPPSSPSSALLRPQGGVSPSVPPAMGWRGRGSSRFLSHLWCQIWKINPKSVRSWEHWTRFPAA